MFINTVIYTLCRNSAGTKYNFVNFILMYMYMYTTAKKKRPNQLGYLVGIWL